MSGNSRLAAVFCAAVVACIGVGSAFAGESTGNGRYINGSDAAPLNGNSACAYSGQNPEGLLSPSDPNYEPGRVQNWGHIPKTGDGFTRELATSLGLNPGVACNPTKSAGEPG